MKQLHQKQIKSIKLLLLPLTLIALVFGINQLSPKVSAVAEPVKVSYMQIYSAKGTYTRAKISLDPNGVLVDKHCGGDLKASNSYTVTIKLYATRPHKILCDPVGGGVLYQVTFLKGRKTGATTNYVNTSPAFSSVDVNGPAALPWKSCMVLKPGSGPSMLQSNCPAPVAETPPVDASQLSIHLRTPTVYNATSAPKGHIRLVIPSPWDYTGAQPVPNAYRYLSRSVCTGTVTVTYTRTDVAGAPQNIVKKLRYAKPTSTTPYSHCEVKLSKDKAQIARKATYQMTASFGGNAYMTASNASAVTFTTK